MTIQSASPCAIRVTEIRTFFIRLITHILVSHRIDLQVPHLQIPFPHGDSMLIFSEKVPRTSKR